MATMPPQPQLQKPPVSQRNGPPPIPLSGDAAFDAIGPMVRRYLPLLMEKAKGESSSALYAEFILDSIPEDFDLAPLMEHSNEQIVAYFATLHPPVQTVAPWFMSLLDEIRLMLEPDEEPIPESPPGDAPSM